jgi:hypothetical protein
LQEWLRWVMGLLTSPEGGMNFVWFQAAGALPNLVFQGDEPMTDNELQ